MASQANKSRDTGLAAVLISLLVAYFTDHRGGVVLAIGLLVVTMTWPNFYRPLSGLWFGLADLLGKIASTIVLATVFALVTTPIGLLRRWMGADPMRSQEWKRSQESVFVDRDAAFSTKDLEAPF